MTIVWKVLDTLTHLDALTPTRQLPHRNGGNRLPRRARNMKDIDETCDLQKANNLIGRIDERKQTLTPHELSRARKQERQTCRVDKANSLTIDDNAAHAAVDQSI